MIAALGIAGWGAWFDGHLQRGPALPDYPGRPPTAGGTTWLLVGSDSREQLSAAEQQRLSTGGDLGIGHTDTLLLVRLPALGADVPATVVSIPRDSYLPIPGYGPDKVNVAFALPALMPPATAHTNSARPPSASSSSCPVSSALAAQSTLL